MNHAKAVLLPFLRDSAEERAFATACGIRLDISRQRLSASDFDRLLEVAEKKGSRQPLPAWFKATS